MKEILVIAFLIFLTGTNFYIYKLTKDKYIETFQQLWNWEAYIRRWLKDELKCHLLQD